MFGPFTHTVIHIVLKVPCHTKMFFLLSFEFFKSIGVCVMCYVVKVKMNRYLLSDIATEKE